MSNIYLIYLVFFLILFSLSLCIVKSTIHVLVKLFLVLACSAGTIWTVVAINELYGWPIEKDLPEKYILYGIAFDEDYVYIMASDITSGTNNVVNIFGLEIRLDEPRVYKFVRTEEDEKGLINLAKLLGKMGGRGLLMSRSFDGNSSGNGPPGNGKGNRKGNNRTGSPYNVRIPGLDNIKFGRVMIPPLPPKQNN